MTETLVALLLHEQEHAAPEGHPENAARLKLIATEIKSRLDSGAYQPLVVTSHGLDPIVRVHWDSYLRETERASKEGQDCLDPDTFISPGSFTAAVAVVDACLSGVETVMKAEHRHAFILGRPPGHHALAHRAMGFCIFNNVAVAAQYALDHLGVSRVAIVDFDVHHGNGTQAVFYDRPDVLYCSTHRAIFFPGTGYPEEIGSGEGKGFTVNRPLMAGDGDREFLAAHTDSFLPALERFKPDLLIVSAGFDAHRLDPLGGLSVTGAGYRKAGQILGRVAHDYCRGRVLSVLEGGYDAQGNLEAITSYLEGLSEP